MVRCLQCATTRQPAQPKEVELPLTDVVCWLGHLHVLVTCALLVACPAPPTCAIFCSVLVAASLMLATWSSSHRMH
jgi:hypothetical protein